MENIYLTSLSLYRILDELALTTPDETQKICSAIYHHDGKEVVDAPFDEVLKDADVMHHTMNGLSKPIKDKDKACHIALRRELAASSRQLKTLRAT